MGYWEDFKIGRMVRDNPEFAKQYYARQQQQANQGPLNDLLGTKATPQQSYQTQVPTEGPMPQGTPQGAPRVSMPINQITQEAKAGTGLLGGQIPPVQAAVELMKMQGQPQQVGGQLFNSLYKPQAAGEQGLNIVGVPQKLGNGNLGYLDGSTGKMTDTGTSFFNAFKPVMINDTPHLLNTNTGQILRTNVGGQPITPQSVAQQKASSAGQVAEATAGAQAKVSSQKTADEAAGLAEGAMSYVNTARGLAKKMNEMQLGPLAGRIPDLTHNSQLLTNQLNNLIGNVRLKLGPGLLSNTDIALLRTMIPNTKMDKSVVLESLDLFEAELKRIISKKTGHNFENKAMPEIGEVRGGFKYLGGDPSKKESWSK